MLRSLPPAITSNVIPPGKAGQGQEGSRLHLLHLQANPLGCPREKEPPERRKLWQMEEKGEGRRSRKVNGRRPDGAPELAECRQGQRGRRLKRTQTVSEEEEEKTCPMGVEGSAAINHRTGFSAFLLVKGQARKRAQAASELIKARRPWMSSHQAVSGLITLCVLGGCLWLPPQCFHQSQLATMQA